MVIVFPSIPHCLLSRFLQNLVKTLLQSIFAYFEQIRMQFLTESVHWVLMKPDDPAFVSMLAITLLIVHPFTAGVSVWLHPLCQGRILSVK